ncbi:4-hydroxythreonine-4-phosphate dehydrogenase PdxA [Flavilitoribacter nigricans]|uniref:4-hydroxythreonine-4-phosphate dehydrogenase PdxA n=1 Tax=Flavilitoribacter nigricans (strain ATCC 23147 / DSM 23189 / NBRC 102662 / NCIMB 1420 / SS-2) TaxID=1122177 RepID=A0A2D0N2T5_FLAN2|nr:4-hydroxythreonine-4-phosphate dehydrogenase PdxA [Flavilitoribacter nigricans]PHN02449.1 4-hydroxythreonine-4-phosphate dehydrogenase PdxA [Flavilitoribacter nigricans DSM 23189 = NBRC 102662]
MKKPVIGITMGDPAGIGPEIILKACTDPEVRAICNPVVIGETWVLEASNQTVGSDLEIRSITKIAEADFAFNILNVFDLNVLPEAPLEYGVVKAEYGNLAFEVIRKTIELAMEGEIDATVTAPIHKEALNLAGHQFAGHTEIYAHYTDTAKYAMMLAEEHFRIVHVSTHVSLRQACDLVRKPRILETIELAHHACRQLGIESPRIGVAGLNPHASDGGLFGYEETEEIIPAVNEALEKGYQVEGPLPPDTMYPKAAGGFYDCCVAMYHDQGHIPFKVLGFSWDNDTNKMKKVKGVNITLGLPIIRVSVDHGTAMEIAGKNMASPDAMRLSLEYAVRFCQQRKLVA